MQIISLLVTHPFGCVFVYGVWRIKGGFMQTLLLSNYAIDLFEPIAKWLTIGIVSALILVWLTFWLIKFVKKLHGQELGIDLFKLAKKMVIAFTLYALLLGITLLTLEILKKYDDAYLNDNWVNAQIVTHVFIPLLITAIISLVAIITLLILTKKGCAKTKLVGLFFGIAIVIAVIVSLVLIYVYYSNNIVGDGYYTDDEHGFNSTALFVCSSILIVLVVSLAFIVGKNNKTPFDTRSISFAGVCLALSFTLSYIKFEAAWIQGGSITLLSFLPICIFSFVYGMKKGLLVGLIYGILQAIQDPFIVHPAQFLLDYPIAFSMISMSGLFTDLKVLENLPALKFALGATLTAVFRYASHVISGMFAFGAYAVSDGATNFLIYSLAYNSYVFIDIALVIIAGIGLFSSKTFVKELIKTTDK